MYRVEQQQWQSEICRTSNVRTNQLGFMSSATTSCLESNVCWLVEKLRDFFVGNFTSQICHESILKKVTNKTLKHNLTNIQLKTDVRVTGHHWYNNMKSQLDATIIILLLIISISSTDDAACWQHRRCFIPQAVNTA